MVGAIVMLTNGRDPFGIPDFGGERWPISVLTRAPNREEARMNPIETKTMRLVRSSLNREVATVAGSYKLCLRGNWVGVLCPNTCCL